MKPKWPAAQSATVFTLNYMLFLRNGNGKVHRAVVDSLLACGRIAGSRRRQKSVNTGKLLGLAEEVRRGWGNSDGLKKQAMPDDFRSVGANGGKDEGGDHCWGRWQPTVDGGAKKEQFKGGA